MRPPVVRAADLHAAAVAANAQMRPLVALRHLRGALALLDSADAGGGPDAATARRLRGRVLVTAALAESERGEVDEGLRLLDLAAPLLPTTERGEVFGQRGILLRRTGHDDLAEQSYVQALALLDPGSSAEEVARVHLNRSVLHIAAARPAAARADLRDVLELAGAHGLRRLAAKAHHNLGALDHLAGDVPGALAEFRVAAEEYAVVAPGMLPALGLDRARTLLTAGLVTEADHELAVVVRRLGSQRVGQDLAEAHLERAEAALLVDAPAAARAHARRAERILTLRGNPRWLARARLVEVRADLARGGTRGRDLSARATVLREDLLALGLAEHARVAGTVAARAMVREGAREQRPEAATASSARSLLLQSRPRAHDRLDTRLAWRLGMAEAGLADGDARRARTHAARGLADLTDVRSRLGTADLRGATAVHGRELARLGLELAVGDGHPGEVLAWSERARAQALLLPPVLPPHDPLVATWLEELRSLDASLAAERADRQVAATQRARRAELRTRLREHSWTTTGTGRATRRVRLGPLRDALDGAALVSYLPVGRELVAFVVRGGRTELVTLGRQQQVSGALRRVLTDLDASVGQVLPDRLAVAVMRSLERGAEHLQDLLLGDVLARIGDRPLVVVPTGILFSVPWGVLPATRGRPVSVAPSATAWVRAREGVVRGLDPTTRALLVSGPRLTEAEAEAARLSAHFAAPVVLAGRDAAVEAVLGHLSEVDVAHLATHGHHVPDNALFSGLELADGRLMGYEVQSLPRVPRLVVLSACDVGRHDVRPGDESLGVATAFLGAGASTVIASVTRVSDGTIPQVMGTAYRALAVGRTPARAVAEAAAGTGLVCFGAG